MRCLVRPFFLKVFKHKSHGTLSWSISVFEFMLDCEELEYNVLVLTCNGICMVSSNVLGTSTNRVDWGALIVVLGCNVVRTWSSQLIFRNRIPVSSIERKNPSSMSIWFARLTTSLVVESLPTCSSLLAGSNMVSSFSSISASESSEIDGGSDSSVSSNSSTYFFFGSNWWSSRISSW